MVSALLRVLVVIVFDLPSSAEGPCPNARQGIRTCSRFASVVGNSGIAHTVHLFAAGPPRTVAAGIDILQSQPRDWQWQPAETDRFCLPTGWTSRALGARMRKCNSNASFATLRKTPRGSPVCKSVCFAASGNIRTPLPKSCSSPTRAAFSVPFSVSDFP